MIERRPKISVARHCPRPLLIQIIRRQRNDQSRSRRTLAPGRTRTSNTWRMVPTSAFPAHTGTVMSHDLREPGDEEANIAACEKASGLKLPAAAMGRWPAAGSSRARDRVDRPGHSANPQWSICRIPRAGMNLTERAVILE